MSTARPASLSDVRQPYPNGTLSTEETVSERRADRSAALELRIREQDEAAQLAATELRAMERDLAVKDAFIRRLERGQELLSVELAQVRERAAELFGDLERSEARAAAAEAAAADAAAELAAVRASAAFRLGSTAVGVGRRSASLRWLGRRLLAARPAGR